MTLELDEAIKHAEEVAEEKRYEYQECLAVHDMGNAMDCGKCGEDHRQLAEWLKELKKLREQTRWIPVSESLPKEDGFYLATCDGEICGEDEPISSIAEFENGKWVDDEDDYQCVLAWMPLPQPYKAESEGQMSRKITMPKCPYCGKEKEYRDGGRDIDGDYVEGNYSKELYDAIMSLPKLHQSEVKKC